MDEIAYAAEISKPTIYQYFKTKDDLYFTLMLPVVEDIGRQLELVEKDLDLGLITRGSDLINRFFGAFYHSYELSSDTFRIVQAFQQQGLVMELAEVHQGSPERKRVAVTSAWDAACCPGPWTWA